LRLLPLAILALAAAKATAADAKKPKKHPVPSLADQKRVQGPIYEVYKAHYEQAEGNPVRLTTLAKALFDEGAKEKEPVKQFVKFRLSRDIAAKASNIWGMDAAVNALAERFAIDSLKMKTVTLPNVADNARTLQQRAVLVEYAFALIDEALIDGRFDLAKQLAEKALESSKKAGNRAIAHRAGLRIKGVEEMTKAGVSKLEDMVFLTTLPLEHFIKSENGQTKVHEAVKLAGKTYDHGVAMTTWHKGRARATYQLHTQYSSIRGRVGIMSRGRSVTYGNTAVVFQIWGDKNLLWSSRLLQKTDKQQMFVVSVADVKVLYLVTLGSHEHGGVSKAVWADAVLVKKKQPCRDSVERLSIRFPVTQGVLRWPIT